MQPEHATLPGLDIPERPRSLADILRRHLPEEAAAPAPRADAPSPTLPIPQPPRAPRTGTASRRAHRHELPAQGGYELRLHGDAIVRVLPEGTGWQVANLGAGCTRKGYSAREADALAQRIARLAEMP